MKVIGNYIWLIDIWYALKKYGGLGIPDLKDLNLCLLGSWVKRFIKDEGKL
jgi:hypothetical protein